MQFLWKHAFEQIGPVALHPRRNITSVYPCVAAILAATSFGILLVHLVEKRYFLVILLWRKACCWILCGWSATGPICSKACFHKNRMMIKIFLNSNRTDWNFPIRKVPRKISFLDCTSEEWWSKTEAVWSCQRSTVVQSFRSGEYY